MVKHSKISQLFALSLHEINELNTLTVSLKFQFETVLSKR